MRPFRDETPPFRFGLYFLSRFFSVLFPGPNWIFKNLLGQPGPRAGIGGPFTPRAVFFSFGVRFSRGSRVGRNRVPELFFSGYLKKVFNFFTGFRNRPKKNFLKFPLGNPELESFTRYLKTFLPFRTSNRPFPRVKPPFTRPGTSGNRARPVGVPRPRGPPVFFLRF